MGPSLLCVHIHLFSSIRENLCECRNASVKFPCDILFYLCLSSADLFIFDVIASIKSMESMECMYEKVSRNVTFSGIHRNTQIFVMW